MSHVSRGYHSDIKKSLTFPNKIAGNMSNTCTFITWIQIIREHNVWKKWIKVQIKYSCYFVELPRSNVPDYRNFLTFPWTGPFPWPQPNFLTFSWTGPFPWPQPNFLTFSWTGPFPWPQPNLLTFPWTGLFPWPQPNLLTFPWTGPFPWPQPNSWPFLEQGLFPGLNQISWPFLTFPWPFQTVDLFADLSRIPWHLRVSRHSTKVVTRIQRNSYETKLLHDRFQYFLFSLSHCTHMQR